MFNLQNILTIQSAILKIMAAEFDCKGICRHIQCILSNMTTKEEGDQMRIALISCTSSKKSYSCKASEMYTPSPRFSLAYRYAKQVADIVYVLSAKYVLLSEEDVIEPYNVTMNNKPTEERRVWSELVIKSLAERHSLDSDEFIIIAGRAYNEFIIPVLKHHTLPLEGQSMGRWIPKLKELIGSNSTLQTDHATSLMIHDWMTNLLYRSKF